MNAELIETDFQRELAGIEAESMGWTPLVSAPIESAANTLKSRF